MSFFVKPLEQFKQAFRGDVFTSQDEGYNDARQIWNAMIDKHPAVIARCATVDDVSLAVRFAVQQDLPIAIRSGGHNIAGSALCDDGLVIDLSQMKTAHVDPTTRRGSIQSGGTLGDFDVATQAHGLATPLGINSTTGIAGLTLGGGFGWLSREYGMTVDNLIGADVVTAEGEIIHTDASSHPDLFWALRGGGGNFGVVTRFEYQLHPVGPNVLAGLIVYPLEQAPTVLPQYRDFILNAPNELTVWTILRKAPPLPFLDESVHGTNIVVLAFCYADDPSKGKPLIEPLRAFGTPVGEHVGVQPYVEWQQAFDPLLTPGARNYWKSNNFTQLPDDLLGITVEAASTLPSDECEIFYAALGGATSEPAPDATAYAHRNTRFVMNVHARWQNPQDDDRCITWARNLFARTAPFSSGSVYLNFMTAEETNRTRNAYGPNYERLAKIKKKYDPHNRFRVNLNIQPA